ncbi:MAG: DEAD/DEAH box helicase family protein [Bacteroidota bacterium]|nr:DEAD/DEAH box helicase family protein [Bacteroidota bacterium]
MNTPDLPEVPEYNNEKQLYAYQRSAIEEILKRLEEHSTRYNLLYQLPTGGGKTVIFSEIAKRYIQKTGKKVLILTHRVELCAQTAAMLHEFGVVNKVIDSSVKEMPVPNEFMCFVAMVETLNNRLRDKMLDLDNIGLMIVDEAHYNSFVKLFRFYDKGMVLGVTATPLSSNINIRMRDNYDELIVGESISSLIEAGFLARAVTYHYHVGLTSLKVGRSGDYTVSSSERLYNNHVMQDKLLSAYREKGVGKKTLIFNNGIATSHYVYATFREAGYSIKHLDHTHTTRERKEILQWFREKPDAILTSVSILTTGFDEPSLECIILNRATKSLTLYFQMIGRGSRVFKDKKEFTVIDLGNNLNRFGMWDAPIDWASIFRSPESYLANIRSDEEIEHSYKYVMPEELRLKFPNSAVVDFDIKEECITAKNNGERPKIVLDRSIEQHIHMCVDNSEGIDESLALAELLKEEIDYRVRVYSRCLSKTSESYVKWLQDEYKRKLKIALIKHEQKHAGGYVDDEADELTPQENRMEEEGNAEDEMPNDDESSGNEGFGNEDSGKEE